MVTYFFFFFSSSIVGWDENLLIWLQRILYKAYFKSRTHLLWRMLSKYGGIRSFVTISNDHFAID